MVNAGSTELVTLEVLLADETTPPSALDVEIESETDGIIEHSGTTDEAGLFITGSLNSGSQILTVRATDEDDQTG